MISGHALCRHKLVWPGKGGVTRWADAWQGAVSAMAYENLEEIWAEWKHGVVFMNGTMRTYPVEDMEKAMHERTGKLISFPYFIAAM